jgi:hypothetical protein
VEILDDRVTEATTNDRGPDLTAEEAMLSLASLAARTVVGAAATDGWGLIKSRISRFFGQGSVARAELAERRLEQTRTQLEKTATNDLEQTNEQLIATWRIRILDLLEEYPEAVAELRMLMQETEGQFPKSAVSAAGHAVVAGRDVVIAATQGGIAAGTVHGEVKTGNPTVPGLATHQPVPGKELPG